MLCPSDMKYWLLYLVHLVSLNTAATMVTSFQNAKSKRVLFSKTPGTQCPQTATPPPAVLNSYPAVFEMSQVQRGKLCAKERRSSIISGFDSTSHRRSVLKMTADTWWKRAAIKMIVQIVDMKSDLPVRLRMEVKLRIYWDMMLLSSETPNQITCYRNQTLSEQAHKRRNIWSKSINCSLLFGSAL